jgi:hypothetical protein
MMGPGVAFDLRERISLFAAWFRFFPEANNHLVDCPPKKMPDSEEPGITRKED